MTVCPNCKRRVFFPGAIDCLRCGHVFAQPPASDAKIVGEPLYPHYRKPGAWALWGFVLVGILFGAIGVRTAFTSDADAGSCTGRGGLLCLMASTLSEMLFGAKNLNLAEGAVWIAFALLCWSFAWHLYSMWFRPRR